MIGETYKNIYSQKQLERHEVLNVVKSNNVPSFGVVAVGFYVNFSQMVLL